MFRFIHTYTQASFPGLVKSGLWREGDGLKLMHKPSFRPPHDYNVALAKDAPLSVLLRELRCPFYIDRLQGGVGYTNTYPYDPAVTARLRETQGDNFLGFQMHEWASNLRSDMERIEALFRREGVSMDDPAAWRSVFARVEAGELPLFLEAYPAREWANEPPFYGLSSFLAAAYRLYRRRNGETGGMLLPADSYFMAFRAELENGARLLLPEAGWQIPNLRMQLAFARGMANAFGVPWGIYWECWQNTENAGFTIPFSLREGQDEWLEDLLHTGNGHDLPPERREHGGSSLSLAARAWRLAYLSGARYLAEEYGVCNTFRELASFSLSPYGEMKRDFLRFTEAFPAPGEPFVPFAAVLPKDLPMPDVSLGETYLGYPLADPACPLPPEKMRRFKADIEALFGVPGGYGNTGHVLKTGGLPAVCDLVYEDMPEALGRYDYLIDLTGGALSREYGNVVTVQEADRLLDSLLPCRVGGGLLAAYNRTPSGWLMLIMNNDGIRHDRFLPDERLPEAAVTAPLRPRSPDARIVPAAGNGTLRGGSITLEAGEWALLRIA